MAGERDVRVPVGPDAHRWTTVGGCRTVLALARTVTSAVRLLDVLELFRDDFRVQVVFAVDEGSAFSGGVPDLLRAVGARLVPWSQVSRIQVDVAIAASEYTDFDLVDAPIVVVPHGVGFQKYVPDAYGDGVRLGGMVPSDVFRDRDVVLVVSHPDQVAQVARVSPDAAARTVVAGDPNFDRCLASVRLRDHYRRILGVSEDQRLVVLTSTWRGQSLWGRWHDLPAQLVAALPADEYQVAAILHPNVWFGHGEWQVRTWLAGARDAGLMLVPPTAGWQAAVVAADVLVGDHGSVTFYGAALDVPVLLAAFGDESVPGTAAESLARLAGRLDPRRPLRGQIDDAIAGHTPGEFVSLVDEAFTRVGQANDRLRQVLYDRMGLPPPSGPAPVRARPPAVPEHQPAASFAVYTEVRQPGVVVVRRFAAPADAWPEEESPTLFRHRATYDDELDQRAYENASVVVRRAVTDEAAASAWTQAELARNSGARIAAAATDSGAVATIHSGQAVRLTAETPLDPMLSAAALYAQLRRGAPTDADVLLRVGTREICVRMRGIRGQ